LVASITFVNAASMVPDFYLVENPIHRYSIGDRTAGVVLDDDGGLTITISHDRPGGESYEFLAILRV
jgi:hypothetical protein